MTVCYNCGERFYDEESLVKVLCTRIGEKEVMEAYIGQDFDEGSQFVINGCPNCLTDAALMDDGWEQTDDGQWCRHEGGSRFMLAQVNRYPDFYSVSFGTVNMDDYGKEERLQLLKSYGYGNLSEFLKATERNVDAETLERERLQLMAEMAFEELFMEYEVEGRHTTYHAAENNAFMKMGEP